MQVMKAFQYAADQETQSIKAKIDQLEKIIAHPFTKERKKPYLLHGILIHDGLAENGHYYSYVFDRS